MANETNFAQAVNVAAYVENNIADYLRSKLVLLGLTHNVPFVKGSDSVKQAEKGTFTATTASESTTHATSQYSQTALPTLQVAEVKVYAELSYKANDYSNINLDEIVDAAGFAVLENVEQAGLALASGYSNNVGTYGSTLTTAAIRAGFLDLDTADVDGPRAGVLHPKQISDISSAIETSSSTLYGNPSVELAILGGQAPQLNGFKGSYMDVPIFSSTNVESVNTDADWGGFLGSPKQAMAFGEDGRGVIVKLDENIEDGVIQIAAYMFYDFKERQDLAGVQVRSVK